MVTSVKEWSKLCDVIIGRKFYRTPELSAKIATAGPELVGGHPLHPKNLFSAFKLFTLPSVKACPMQAKLSNYYFHNSQKFVFPRPENVLRIFLSEATPLRFSSMYLPHYQKRDVRSVTSKRTRHNAPWAAYRRPRLERARGRDGDEDEDVPEEEGLMDPETHMAQEAESLMFTNGQANPIMDIDNIDIMDPDTLCQLNTAAKAKGDDIFNIESSVFHQVKRELAEYKRLSPTKTRRSTSPRA
jgi:hypothetical protein